MKLLRILRRIWDMPDRIIKLEKENRALLLVVDTLLADKKGKPLPEGQRLLVWDLYLN
jgi:hypothetical protein